MTTPSERVLRPQAGRYEPNEVRRLFEGATIWVRGGVLGFTPAPGMSRTRYGLTQYRPWSAPIGNGPGEAAEAVLLRAIGPRVEVSTYAVTDTAGAVLGFMPTGANSSASDLPEHQAGWFPPSRVRPLMTDAGLRYQEQAHYAMDFRRLNRDYPGAAPGARAVSVGVWIPALVLISLGVRLVTAFWEAWAPQTRPFAALFLCVGLLYAACGVALLPPMVRRWRRHRR